MKKALFSIIPLLFTGSLAISQCIDSSLIIYGACVQIYEPVCGCDGKIYSNSCEATYWHGVTEYYHSGNFKIKGPGTICKGDTVELTATGGLSYTWSTGEVTSTITVSPEVRTIYSVTAVVEGGCEFTKQLAVDVAESSAVHALGHDDLSQIRLYPNPATKYMNIESPFIIKKYRIFSLKGELIRSEAANDKELLIILEDYPAGIYALQIETENQHLFTRKIMIE